MTQIMKSRLDAHFFHIARFVLEADSAFSIGSGLSDSAFDNLVVRDANGLPTIPGTTIAGVLRHLYRQESGGKEGEKAADQLFGNIEKESSAMSRVTFSWGIIHDEEDRPVEKLQPKIEGLFLDTLIQDHPLYRDRVRINEKGVASDKGKFDVTVIPKGCRFSFEITLWADRKEPPEWNNLLSLLQNPMLRLGGSVRSGLGRFKCIRLYHAAFNLKDSSAYEKYCDIGMGLDDYQHLEEKTPAETGYRGLRLTIRLEPEDFWRFGQGSSPIMKSEHPPDALPLVEPFIQWTDNKASINVRHVAIPGSSIKGAIRHRFTFHYGRLLMDLPDGEKRQKVDKAVHELFGQSHETSEKGHPSGQAGQIWFDDGYIAIGNDFNRCAAHMNHSSIDRFTGGVRSGALFGEELIWNQPLKIKVFLNFKDLDELGENTKQALAWTLEDLVNGRLALGAGSAKGHGFFSGTVEWSDGGKRLPIMAEEAA
ncbi:RAMP superfamily CRISPR-associated protein [Desulfosarcina ovata]|uniref:CRISPR type III-associated protein domain-containing protein n=1 Tax=Desulfosarcina ovata subsp. ovata TaxID=2752305 RepID=A0A5K8A4F7_9BACT|nr:RAMP superfamily CRISPR-associated protein [Desulfosarcina ovata]BBO87234.1 hypothetical protein DSCOOX_04140 [Desulfosarcina ovata subsp. ovata]